MTASTHDSGDRFFHIPGWGRQSRDKLLEAVREHTAGELEVFGEMGRGAQGRIVYLARVIARPNSLVILRLDPSDEPNNYDLDRLQTLDSSVPSTGLRCPRAACGAELPGWGRFCPMCAMDLGVTTDAPPGMGGEELLQSVRDFAFDEYDVLGYIPRTEGNGYVFFARDREFGDITALRLEPTNAGTFKVGVTGVLPRIARAADQQHPPPASYVPPTAMPAATPKPPPPTRPVLQQPEPAIPKRTPPEPQKPVTPRRPVGTMVGRPRAQPSLLESFSFLGDPRVGIALVVLVVVLVFVAFLI